MGKSAAEQSICFYDNLAFEFYGISQSRMSYLNGIDDIIFAWAPGGRYLDVGAGDGRRAMKISSAIKATSVTTIDSSPEMHLKCLSAGLSSRCVSLEDFDCEGAYDTITCLWNVLGHADDPSSSIEKMIEMLRPGGKLFVDVNNKCNASQYGWACSLLNAITGKKKFSIGQNTEVRLFAPWELDRCFKDTKMTKMYVDYNTGEVKWYSWKGQILYIAER